jgi:hypothetical protein
MSALTNYAENKVLDHMLGTTGWTFPSQAYLALHTADPTETGAVSELSSTNGYIRQAIDFNAASGGTTDNSNAPEFTASGGNWGTITHWSLWDAATSGNPLTYGSFAASKVINNGDTARITAGSLDVTAA